MENSNHDIIPPGPLERFSFLKKDKSLRFNTFKKFSPSSSLKVKVDELINNGYIYVGNGISIEVQCTHCGNIMKVTGGFENIYEEHRRLFPQCPFRMDKTYSADHIDMSKVHIQIDSITNDTEVDTKKKIYNKNIYAKYQNYNDRLASFINWSGDYLVKPEDCAKAGLYYKGPDDLCACYYCGGELDCWEEGDIPQTEHDTNFSTVCGLVDLTDRCNVTTDNC